MSDTASRPFWLIARHELRVLIADRTLPLVCLLLAALTLYGLATGLIETANRDAVVAELSERQAAKDVTNVQRWHDVMVGRETPDPFSNPVDPASVGSGLGSQYAILPTLPLSPTAAGQSDMLPDYYRVTYRSRVSFMYDGEVENPWNLLSGRFDLAFVLVYLLPLFVFAISYNLLSTERDQGTLRMLLSQPLTLSRLMAAKVAVRAAAVIGVVTAVPALALVIFRPELLSLAGLGLLALWALLVAVYALFWFALLVLVNAFGRSSAANALILIGSWVLLVLVAPVVMNLAVSAASPAPSRTELATQTRLVQIDGLNRYNDLLSADYRYTDQADVLLPRDGRLEVSPRLRGFYLTQTNVDRRLQPMLDDFDTQLAGQQALVDRFGVLSPAVVLNEGLASLSGNGSRRYQDFQHQVIAYHEAWKTYFVPRVLNGVAITERDFAEYPRWRWRERPKAVVGADALIRVLQLFGAVALMTGLAVWRLRRYRVV